jgi:hypothetical protein
VYIKDNKNLETLLHENKLDIARQEIQIKSANITETELFEENKKEKYINLFLKNRLLEIKLGDIHSFPNHANLKLNSQTLSNLEGDDRFKYEVSLLGKKLEESEDLGHINNHGYSIILFKI